jgi:hypothetical protein
MLLARRSGGLTKQGVSTLRPGLVEAAASPRFAASMDNCAAACNFDPCLGVIGAQF